MATLASKLTGRRYRLLASLARGGMGEVFVGEAVGTPRPERYAIKTLLPAVLEQENMLERFLDEARLSARLDHPNIARLVDFGEAAGRPFAAFELLVGANLGECLDTRIVAKSPIPQEVALALISQAARGLHHAHTLEKDGLPLQVVHRDLSPSNLFLTSKGEVKVLDFGAAWGRDRITHTATGMIIGKLEYMSPEQVRAQPVDARTDVFALGLCMHELFTLQRPYAASNEREQIARIFHAQVKPLESQRRGLDKAIYRAVHKAVAADPLERFQSALELAEALEQILGARNATEVQKLLRGFYVDCFGKDREARRTAALDALANHPEKVIADFAWEAPSLASGESIAVSSGDVLPAREESETDPEPDPGGMLTAQKPAVEAAPPTRFRYTGVVVTCAAVLLALFVGLLIGRMGASVGP